MHSWLIKKYSDSNYIALFNRVNGAFIRYGENNIDPFYNVTGPELLDISITNYCERRCNFCYRGSNINGEFMSLDDYNFIIQQARSIGVLQVALGGGNPNQHPQFTQILKSTYDNDIIPSYTTNGQGMTDNIFKTTKELCGAMAVSWYAPYIEAQELIDKANEYKIKINIHFLLDNNTILSAIKLLEEGDEILKKINAIVFLNYKPIHSSSSLCLTDNDNIRQFFQLIQKIKTCKIGFDSCMISYLTLIENELVFETTEFCEAARFSAYISEELLFYPCSFLNDIYYLISYMNLPWNLHLDSISNLFYRGAQIGALEFVLCCISIV